VPASGELLFGKIAVLQNLCSQAQVDECARLQLQMQSPHQPAPKLGELLVEKGYLTRSQADEVLVIQRRNLDLVDPMVKKRKEAVLFGRLAVREGLTTQEELHECLALQAQPGERRTLGEIMVGRGYLTSVQVTELLGRQLKRIMSCPACRLSFTVLTLSEGKRVDCPKCRGPLQDGKPSDSTRTDAEFATQVLRAVKAGLPVPKTDSRVIPSPSSRIRVVCVICDSAFQAPLDATGRVRCPECHSTFTPK
jgi:protein-arginine kinase activator protein McsA